MAGLGGGLYREILPEAGVPGKSRLQLPGGLADAVFVVQMERRGELLGELLQLLLCHKGSFHGVTFFSFSFYYNKGRAVCQCADLRQPFPFFCRS